MSSKITNVHDLATIFYNIMLDNNEDYIEPDSKSGRLMTEINKMIFSLTDFRTGSDIESKIMEMAGVDSERYYCWGFAKGLEVANVVMGRETENLAKECDR